MFNILSLFIFHGKSIRKFNFHSRGSWQNHLYGQGADRTRQVLMERKLLRKNQKMPFLAQKFSLFLTLTTKSLCLLREKNDIKQLVSHLNLKSSILLKQPAEKIKLIVLQLLTVWNSLLQLAFVSLNLMFASISSFLKTRSYLLCSSRNWRTDPSIFLKNSQN
jgi:hypothetical protein